MQLLKWIFLNIIVLLSGCELHHPQTLSKQDTREHLRTYVNTPRTLMGSPTLPGNITYKSLNSKGVTAIEQGNEIKFIIPVDLFFEQNSYEVKSSHISTVNIIGKVLKSTKGPIVIIGNTDNIGSRSYKSMQSKKLAEAIKNKLWLYGIEQRRMLTKGASDRRPISSASVKGKTLNRRVEIITQKI